MGNKDHWLFLSIPCTGRGSVGIELTLKDHKVVVGVELLAPEDSGQDWFRIQSMTCPFSQKDSGSFTNCIVTTKKGRCPFSSVSSDGGIQILDSEMMEDLVVLIRQELQKKG